MKVPRWNGSPGGSTAQRSRRPAHDPSGSLRAGLQPQSLTDRLDGIPEPAPNLAKGQSQEERDGPYIECRDLFKIYKRADLEVVALRGVDLEVEAGELVAIVGASGSGKSTLLNILSGLDRPSAGQVSVGGRDLLDVSDRQLVLYRRLDVGFVWQATARNLIPYLTVRDNIELPMAIAGVNMHLRRTQSMDFLESLGMEGKAKRLPHQLSGGEQQRVAIGVAMANRPPLLLADEPTGELDTQTAVQVFDLLRHMNQLYHVTVVVVTHYPGVAQHVDRTLLIRDGRISSESFLQPTFQRSGGTVHHEYLVVDRVGRLQLPQEYVEKLRLGGLAKADIDGDQVTIKPAVQSYQPGQPSSTGSEQDLTPPVPSDAAEEDESQPAPNEVENEGVRSGPSPFSRPVLRASKGPARTERSPTFDPDGAKESVPSEAEGESEES